MSLSLTGIHKSFPGENGAPPLKVLAGLDCAVEAGRLVSVVGPSGCGKTTLLRIIAGLEPADRGRVLWQGAALAGPSRRVGMVFQQYALLPWRSTLGNIELGLEMAGLERDQRRAAAREYVEAFGLAGFEHSFPHQLSGGMQQRVAIARTLILKPELVLMDEPFGSLDSQTRDAMQEFLLSLWQQRQDTIVFVTHNVDEAVFLSDEILVLSRRPARVLARLEVPQARPRDRTSPASNDLRRQILSLLKQEQVGLV
ncbi:MAG: ABC transporter ATP-binding protein [Desulfarculus sp.]|nr:MAG: ABC transporter ATP-binding protein [Desulfarculus sp.]